MKYCRSCKTRGRDDATTCATCGQPLTTLAFGSGSSDAASGDGGDAPAVLELRGKIEELKAARERQSRLSRRLMVVCALVAASLLFVGMRVYAATVLVYAKLADVKIEQDPRDPTKIATSFRVVAPGRVSFERRSGGARTEKVDEFHHAQSAGQSWKWPSDPGTGIEFDVVYREGWTRSFVRKRFDVSAVSLKPAIDVVFLLDTTYSMEPLIEGLKNRCIEFAAGLRGVAGDVRLGLVAYGDVGEKEPIRVFPLTAELQKFQWNVAHVPRTSGGDDPESSVDALDRALGMEFRPGAAICFVLITDADTHRKQELHRIESILKERDIVSSVVSSKMFEPVYSRICLNGGTFQAISSADFSRLLDNVARTIASAIQSR